MSFLKVVGYGIHCLFTALHQAFRRQIRACYRTQVDIAAPAGLVWQLLTARAIEFGGLIPHRIDSIPRQDGTKLVDCRITVGGEMAPFTYRVLDERPGKALLIEVVNELTDPCLVQGDEHYVATTLTEDQDGMTRLGIVTEITPTSAAGRFWVPMSVFINALKIKRRAEEILAPRPAGNLTGRISAAAFTGLVTFASFMHVFGWQYAAMAILVILIHEVGHVVGMRWVGVRVHGIYFLPFIGSVAVGDSERTAGESGLVALMGPGFSLLTTALFFLSWRLSEDSLMRELAMTSAFLNALNLLPLTPLDGGRVVRSLISRTEAETAQWAHMGMLAASIGAACWLNWLSLALLLVLRAPMVMSAGDGANDDAPADQAMAITPDQSRLLLAAYTATFTFYAGVLMAL